MSNIYDGAFRTILNDCRKLIIPVINEIFKEEYTGKEKIADCIKYHFSWRRYNNCQGPWCFPLTMSENDIIDAIHKAYLNAGKRSRRITPEPVDYENINKAAPRYCFRPYCKLRVSLSGDGWGYDHTFPFRL